MFFLGDAVEFKKGRRRGSRNKYRKTTPGDDYYAKQQRREEINNNRKVVGTALSASREARGWARFLI